MKVFAVANQKGGVGKTTTAVTLGGALSKEGRRVLLVDLDPHGSMTTYFGHDPDAIVHSVYTLFKQRADRKPVRDYSSVLLPTDFSNLTLLPASTALATLDRQLGTEEGMGLVIAQTLQDLQQDYDYVFIDCPPMLGVLMVNALASCDRLLIPVQTEFLALKGLERMLHTLQMIRRARSQSFPYTIIPTMFDRRTRASGEALAVMRERYQEELWGEVIPVDTQFREASKAGIPLSIAQPRSRGAVAYVQLLRDLIDADHPPPAPTPEVDTHSVVAP